MTEKKAYFRDIKTQLILVITLLWLICVGIYSVSLLYLIKSNNSRIQESLQYEFDTSVYLITQGLDEVISDSRLISYEGDIEYSITSYREDALTYSEMHKSIDLYLHSKYSSNPRYDMYIFYTLDDPTILYSAVNDYYCIQNYRENVHPVVMKRIKSLDTNILLTVIDEQIYAIRKLYDVATFEALGVLVLVLNNDYITAGKIPNVEYSNSVFIDFADDESNYFIGETLENNYIQSKKQSAGPNFTRIESNYIAVKEVKNRDYHFYLGQLIDEKSAFSDISKMRKQLILLLCAVIPMLFIILYFVKRQVINPINQLLSAFQLMRNGELSVKVSNYEPSSHQFDALISSFEEMSSRIEYLFSHVYTQEMAQRDATILALQSQINPHFLNNTLEMINWQARIDGSEKVPEMLSALSRIFDASMNRDGKITISLREEVENVDAYLFISSMRMGDRLKIERHIDDGLLDLQVPSLLLQPIIENAIIHGIDPGMCGEITISIYEQDDRIMFDVFNTGKVLTDKEIIDLTAQLNAELMRSERKVGLGIRNVHDRIKLIYGEEYGVSIMKNDESRTLVRIVLPKNSKTMPKTNN